MCWVEAAHCRILSKSVNSVSWHSEHYTICALNFTSDLGHHCWQLMANGNYTKQTDRLRSSKCWFSLSYKLFECSLGAVERINTNAVCGGHVCVSVCLSVCLYPNKLQCLNLCKDSLFFFGMGNLHYKGWDKARPRNSLYFYSRVHIFASPVADLLFRNDFAPWS